MGFPLLFQEVEYDRPSTKSLWNFLTTIYTPNITSLVKWELWQEVSIPIP